VILEGMMAWVMPRLRQTRCAARWLGLLMVTSRLWGQAAPVEQTIVIRASKLFDSDSGRMVDRPTIVVRGSRIESVGSGDTPIPPNAHVIDLGDATVFPGFVDVHTHLTVNAGNARYEALGISPPRAALVGAKNARLTLLAGFTSVRNVGAEGYADVALRDAINAGDGIGPRMQASGPPLGITGGHCDSNLLAPEFHSPRGRRGGRRGSRHTQSPGGGVVFRLIIFYVLAISVVMLAMTPWNHTGSANISGSPFVRAFETAGIPFAASIMNLVVISAALSSANTNLYLSTRMLFSLSRGQYAPAWQGRPRDFDYRHDGCDCACHISSKKCFPAALRYCRGRHVLCVDRYLAHASSLSPKAGAGDRGQTAVEAASSSMANRRRKRGSGGNCRQHILGRWPAVHDPHISPAIADNVADLHGSTPALNPA
jgi:hypothetical protein